MNIAGNYTRYVRMLWAIEASIKSLQGQMPTTPEPRRSVMENRVFALKIEAENTRYHVNKLRPKWSQPTEGHHG
jgi:hypothetical protein